MAGEHAGHRQRMRERFLANGLEGFADHEVLEFLLFYAIPRQNTNPLAHRLLKSFGSLHAVLDASPAELARVEGIGERAAVLMSLFSHTARRLQQSRMKDRDTLANRSLAKLHCAHLLRGLREECFYVVCLGGQMQVLGDVLISRGTVDEVQAYPRKVAEAILRHNARSVLLCHNHPGGSSVPSHQDVQVTYELGTLCTSLGVMLADHMIVTETDVLSMVECGIISVTRRDPQGTVDVKVADPAGEVALLGKLKGREGKKQR